MAPAGFWEVTPREIAAIMAGVEDRLWYERRQAQQMVYSQAVLNAQAWHQPNKMMAFDKAFPDRFPAKAKSVAEIMAKMKSATAAIRYFREASKT